MTPRTRSAIVIAALGLIGVLAVVSLILGLAMMPDARSGCR